MSNKKYLKWVFQARLTLNGLGNFPQLTKIQYFPIFELYVLIPRYGFGLVSSSQQCRVGCLVIPWRAISHHPSWAGAVSFFVPHHSASPTHLAK